MKALFAIFRRHARATLPAAILSFLVGLGTTALVAMANALATGRVSSRSGVIAFVCLCVGLPAVMTVADLLLGRVAERVKTDLTLEVTGRIFRAPFRKLEEIGQDRLMALLVEDVAHVGGGVMAFPGFLIALVIALSCFAYLASLSFALFGVLCAFLAAFIPVTIFVRRRRMRGGRAVSEASDVLFGHLRRVTAGIKELKLSRASREGFLGSDLRPAREDVARHSLGLVTLSAFERGLGNLGVFVCIGVVVFFGRSVFGVATPDLATFALVLLFLNGPIAVVLVVIQAFARASISMHRIDGVMHALEAPASPGEASGPPLLPAAPSFRGLELHDVTHSYRGEADGRTFVLGPVTLALRPGEIVFLVGGNGSGKSTLAKLLVGLYTPESGHVSANGVPVDERSRDDYRELFSVVFYDYFLPDEVRIDHVGSEEAALRHLSELGLAQKVSLRDGLLRTGGLSAGQRKRLALLVAYLQDRPIYLFDEWASDQDPAFKQVFYLHILPELRSRGKTVVVVTHDDRYFGTADRVVKLEEGRIVESVTPSAER